tara:strand:- start:582 stop:995 length:414 start_codon:yes stop_codon:yes gene_type:complete
MMKTLTFIFVLFSITSFAQTEESKQCSISKNGVYYSPIDSISHIYIRFSEGDTVYTTSSDIDYDLATKYVISKNHDHLMHGTFQVNERRCLVRLKAKNEYGKVKMDGIISDDKLILTVINKSDNTSKDFVFNFFPEI